MRIGVVWLSSAICLFSTDHVFADSVCPMPLVSKKTVALGIYNSVMHGLETTRQIGRYRTIIEDGGSSWTVFQLPRIGSSVRHAEDASGRKLEIVQVIAGGGGLEMKIDKCTGAITSAHFSR